MRVKQRVIWKPIRKDRILIIAKVARQADRRFVLDRSNRVGLELLCKVLGIDFGVLCRSLKLSFFTFYLPTISYYCWFGCFGKCLQPTTSSLSYILLNMFQTMGLKSNGGK